MTLYDDGRGGIKCIGIGKEYMKFQVKKSADLFVHGVMEHSEENTKLVQRPLADC